eukprot:TRINITY_DN17692_c0_g1_i1.p1 TRINITY_DN17692_c0_g1~~TRINITY_DN17692_c0_g1_i1.p1  ORF type:complete len:1527 (+),score=410.22 TRINITY_DN17692_c0_g1_i1:73-4653(+)
MVDSTKCVVYGPGLEETEAQKAVSFTVELRNSQNQPIKTGGNTVVVNVIRLHGQVRTKVKDNDNGTYTVEFTPDIPSLYDVHVLVDDNEISKSPFKKKAILNAINPQKYRVKCYVQVEYDSGKEIDEEPEASISVVGPTNTPIPAEIKYIGNGNYSIVYEPDIVGDYTVDAYVFGKQVSGCPYIVNYKGGRLLNKPRFIAEGPGLIATKSVTTGKRTYFNVDGIMPDGSKITQDNDYDVDVEILNPEGASVRPSVRNNEEIASYRVEYTPTKAGVHTIHVKVDGEEAEGSPFKVNVGKPTYVIEPAFKQPVDINQTITYTLSARDPNGEIVRIPSKDVDVHLDGPRVLEAYVDPNKDGTASVVFVPGEVGLYSVTVLVQDHPVTDHPLTLLVGTLPVGEGRASGPGLQSPLRVDEPTQFVIEVVDNGQRINVPKEDVTAGVYIANTRERIPSQLTPKSDNTFLVQYTPDSPSDYDVRITLRNEPIKGSPFRVTAIKPSYSVSCEGPGLVSGAVDQPTTFTVSAQNDKRQPVSLETAQVRVLVRDTNGPIPHKLQANGLPATVTYSPETPGPVFIEVFVEGKKQKEFTYSIQTESSPAHSLAFGPGVESAPVNKPTSFTVQVLDSKNRPVKSSNDVIAVVVHRDGDANHKKEKVEPVQVKNNNDGTYTVSYLPKLAGDHSVDITLNGSAIDGSPYHPVITGTVFTTKSAGQGLQTGTIAKPARFTVEVLPDYVVASGDEPKSAGPEPLPQLQVSVTSPSGKKIPSTLKKTGDGKYQIDYTPTERGKFSVQLSLDERPNAVHNPLIETGVDSSKSIAFGMGLADRVPVSGEPLSFTIEAHDFQDNKVHYGFDDLGIKIIGPDHQMIQPNIRDNQDGTYTVTYQNKIPGEYYIEALLNGKPVAKSPFQVYSFEAGSLADPTKSLVHDAPEHILVDHPVRFVVEAKNSHGQPVNSPGQELTVWVNTPKGKVPASVISQGDGKYSVEYLPNNPGEYQAEIKIDGQPLTKGPIITVASKPSYSCYCEGEGITTAQLNQPTFFLIHAERTTSIPAASAKHSDTLSKPLSLEEAKLTVKITSPSGKYLRNQITSDPSDPLEAGKGVFRVNYAPVNPGVHVIEVKTHSNAAKDSPFQLDVEDDHSVTDSTKQMEDDLAILEAEEEEKRRKAAEKEEMVKFAFNNGQVLPCKVGEERVFTVSILNDEGRMIIPKGSITVLIDTPTGPLVAKSCLKNSFNMVYVSFVPPCDGDFKLHVFYDDVPVDPLTKYSSLGIKNKPPATPVLTDVDDIPFRVPLGKEDETPEEKRARIKREQDYRAELARKRFAEAERLADLEKERKKQVTVQQQITTSEQTVSSSVSTVETIEPEDPKVPKKRPTGVPNQSIEESGPTGTLVGGPKAGSAALGALKVHVDYPEKVLLPRTETTIRVALEDLQLGKFIDEPGADIQAHIKGPMDTVHLKGVKHTEVGVWTIKFSPSDLGTYSSMVTFNGTEVQNKLTKIKCVNKIPKGKIGVITPFDLLKKKDKMGKSAASVS